MEGGDWVMAMYQYEAIDRFGKTIRAEITATDAGRAIERLQREQISIIRISEKRLRDGAGAHRFQLFGRVDDQSLAIFTRQFATLLKVGIPVTRSLATIAKHATQPLLSKTLHEIISDLGHGFGVARSFAKHPNVFSEVYLTMLRIGDGTGQLPDMLERMAEYQEKDFATKRHVQSAMYYPMFVVGVAILAVVSMLVFFVPSFSEIYKNMQLTLPLPTQILLGTVKLFTSPVGLLGVLGVAGLGVYFLANFLNTPVGRYKLDEFKLNMPVLGPGLRKATISRFCRSLATLVNAGVHIMDAFRVLEGIFDNEVIAQMLAEVQEGVRAGHTLSDELRIQPIMPRVVADMIAVGEQTGEVEALLTRLADMYDIEATHALDTMLALMEPLIIAGLALVVGFIMVAIFLPLYGVINSLGV